MKMWRPQQLFVGERAQTKARTKGATYGTINSTKTPSLSNGAETKQFGTVNGPHCSEESLEQRNREKNESQGEFNSTAIKMTSSDTARSV